MLARTFEVGMLKRLGSVVAIGAAWYLVTAWIYNRVLNPSPAWSYGRTAEANRLFSFDLERIDWFSLFGAAFMAVAAMFLMLFVVYGVYSLGRWILCGSRPYVDPCNNPNCPCARHEVERRQAEDARIAAVAASTVAITSTIIN